MRSLDIDTLNDYKEGIQVASQNIGEVFWHKKEYQKSLKFIKQALKIAEELNNIFQISEILVPLIAVLIEMNDYKNAKKYLDKLKQNK